MAEVMAAMDGIGEAQCAEEAASVHSNEQVCVLPHVGFAISGGCTCCQGLPAS